jgi:hypothetical protein
MSAAMNRPDVRLRLCSALLVAVALFGTASRAAQPAKLRRLGGVGDMKAWFNSDVGHVRAIFLLSPT